jgi:NAD(P)-dependent dehydrogenase (short-subunit alcohol dehydrogenase family)
VAGWAWPPPASWPRWATGCGSPTSTSTPPGAAATPSASGRWPPTSTSPTRPPAGRWRAEVEAEAGLALWVNGAGILRTGPSWELSAADTARLFDVNVHGTVNGTAAALEVFRRVGHGHVVNVISLAGLTAPPGETMYAATKHAALAYTLGTAQDLRLHGHEGIHLSAVCPDGIWTPMLYDHVDDPEAALSWSGVLLTPERAAGAIATVVRRPRPVLSVPRWRGGVARVAATMPRLALRTMPQVMAQARRKQAAFRATLADRQRPRRPGAVRSAQREPRARRWPGAARRRSARPPRRWGRP